MRRILLVLVILTLFPLAGLCETGAERLTTLDILSQRDKRLKEEKYYYQGMSFSIAGCRPASITNSLLALLGTPETNAPDLLLEVLYGLSDNPKAPSLKVSVSNLDYRLNHPLPSATQMLSLLERTTDVVTLTGSNSKLPPAEVVAQYYAAPEDHPLIMRDLKTDNCWPWVLEMTEELCRQGHPDARFVFCAASAGSDKTDAPLASGANGHYLTLYFSAREFHEEGTFYLLDSLPRALEGDIYGLKDHYPAQYPFVADRTPFGSIYDATRITEPVLMFTLNDAARAQLANASDAERTSLRIKQMETMILYTRTHFMLYVP